MICVYSKGQLKNHVHTLRCLKAAIFFVGEIKRKLTLFGWFCDSTHQQARRQLLKKIIASTVNMQS